MDKGKWLKILLFDTKLLDNSFLSEKEIFCIKSHLGNEKSFHQIGREIELTDERVRQIIENGLGKVFLATKNFIAKNYLLQKTLTEKEALEKEIRELRKRVTTEEYSIRELELTFDEKIIPIHGTLFSVRALNALKQLNIGSVNQLARVTIEQLTSINKVGAKTINEIVNRAEELGIRIK